MPRLLVNLPDNARLRRMFLPADWEPLQAQNDVTFFRPNEDGATQETFRRLLVDADIMLTGWGSRPLTPDDWEACRPKREAARLFVAHAAGSVRAFVPKELLCRGVRVSQSAAAMAPSVAQWTVCLMLLALRQSLDRTLAQKSGHPQNESLPYSDMTGLTVGLIGLSQVGRRVPPLLAPFGPARIIAYDPYWTPENAQSLGVALVTDLDELIGTCDVVSLHAPVTPETRRMLDARRVGLIKTGAVVINTARTALLDQDALFARAETGEIEYYADVTEPEPLPIDHSAWQNPHVYLTPHIGGATTQAIRGMALFALSEIERFIKDEPLQGEITEGRYDLLA